MSEEVQKFEHEAKAENALFLVSCTPSWGSGKLRQINEERRRNGQKPIPPEHNAQRLLNELEAQGFGRFGWGVAEMVGGEIEEGMPLNQYRTHPLLSEYELRLRAGLGKNADGEDNWLVHFRHYATKTKLGVLILGGDKDFFRNWANSKACRKEVAEIPEDRLFVYLDSCLIRVNQVNRLRSEPAELQVSERAGPGYIVWASGDLYTGPLRNCKQHGQGEHYFQYGDVFEGRFADGQMDGYGVHQYATEDGNAMVGRLEGEWKAGHPVLRDCKFIFDEGWTVPSPTFPWPPALLSEQSVGRDAILKFVFEAEDAKQAKRYPDILQAATAGNLAACRDFLRQNPRSIRVREMRGRTALHWAAIKGGPLELVRHLLENKAEVDALSDISHTPLHLVAINRDAPEVIRCLLENSSGLEARDDAGSTPLHLAAVRGHLENARILMDFRADLNAKDIIGKTPLDRAKRTRQTEVVKLLEEAGALEGSCCVQ